ncbi:hypothetical protein WJX81_007768 [Elliptochloris bilobata]|uniref:Uncharacterized protein n=1 Tax=Elliptochloris bilobata TaxID=381761 RepID=A0AAW1SKC2_9CHLO
MEIYQQYVKPRKEFGRYCRFSDEGAEMLADIRPNEEHAREHIARNPVFTASQTVPEMSEHEVNTVAVIYANKAMNHTEGGWPKEVDCTEAEHVIRYRKKVEKDEGYIRAVASLGVVVEELVKQNAALDLYEVYFADAPPDAAVGAPSMKTLTVLKDPAPLPAGARASRGAQAIAWHPDGSRRVAVAYSVLEFQAQPAGAPGSSYVWDVANPGRPEAELAPASPLVCLAFNLKDASVIGAGCYNGQFAVFDVRRGAAATDATPIEHSHRDPVYELAWLQGKTGTEAMTASSDGYVRWWDTRKLAEPTEALALRERGSEALMGASALAYSPAAGPTKFMVGTEQGVVLACNRKAKNPADRVGTAYPGHHAPITALVRNAFQPKFFLTTGDWTARLWNEDLRVPICTSPYAAAALTAARWSPTRPAVFMVTRADGALDVWDYLASQAAPALVLQVAPCALTALRIHEAGRLAAVGAADGSTAILQLCEGLADLQPNEKATFSAILERETSREKNLEKAQKEAKVRARREAARAADSAAPESGGAAGDANVLLQLEKDFLESTR